MNADEALEEAARAGQFGQFEVSGHALERMAERSATRRDICLALRSATTAIQEDHDRNWRLEGGKHDEGDPLTVVIVFTGRGVIVTVF